MFMWWNNISGLFMVRPFGTDGMCFGMCSEDAISGHDWGGEIGVRIWG